MKLKIFFLNILLLIFCAYPSSAQVQQIRDKKFSKRQEIRKFDFLNATYEANCADGKVKVKNGIYKPTDSSAGYFQLNISVSYGDLTGDSFEEAIVVTQCSGAAQNYDEGKIYAVRNNRLVKLAELEVGTKNGGSILAAKIRNRRVIVTRGPGPELCQELENASQNITTFRLLRNNKLQQIGKTVCKIN